jgi:hypothetical protein
MKYTSASILDALHELHINEEKKDGYFYYIVTFSSDFGSYSRVLKSKVPVDNSMAKKFYAKFCKENDYDFYTIEDSKNNLKMEKILVKDGRVDTYNA